MSTLRTLGGLPAKLQGRRLHILRTGGHREDGGQESTGEGRCVFSDTTSDTTRVMFAQHQTALQFSNVNHMSNNSVQF